MLGIILLIILSIAMLIRLKRSKNAVEAVK